MALDLLDFSREVFYVGKTLDFYVGKRVVALSDSWPGTCPIFIGREPALLSVSGMSGHLTGTPYGHNPTFRCFL